jgi:GDP-L-fucose synthase
MIDTVPRSPYDLTDKRVWVAGHRGMVGSALIRRLESESCEVLTVGRHIVDLRRQSDVENWLMQERPDAIFVAAAMVGGIMANSTRPAEFLYDNLAIESNIVHGAHLCNAEKLLFLGSSCIFPRLAPQPMSEDLLLTGPLEPTNEWYAVAKIAGIKLCEAYRHQYGRDFVSAMPTNLYGPGDNYDLESGHVPAAMIVKCHQALKNAHDHIEVWGTGQPMREFMAVDDLADGLVFMMKNYSDAGFLNIGSGYEISIKDFVETVARVVGFTGELKFDATRPDGAPRKLMDSSRIRKLGWKPSITLEDGLRSTYEWYLENST